MTNIARSDRLPPLSWPHGLARGLGWFSLGLGIMELVAPGRLARSLGMRGTEGLLWAYGLREAAAGLGILSSSGNPATWLWARVAGDALDIGTLASGGIGRNQRKGSVAFVLTAVLGVTLLDVFCAQELTSRQRRATPIRDYSDRRGLPRPPAEMRGAARDKRIPDRLASAGTTGSGRS